MGKDPSQPEMGCSGGSKHNAPDLTSTPLSGLEVSLIITRRPVDCPVGPVGSLLGTRYLIEVRHRET